MIGKETEVRAANLIKNAFREYYFKSTKLEQPARMEQREFGYSLFGEIGMLRHLSFENIGSLVATLVREAPSDVYCSNACYRFPTKPMQEKEWLGAFLIFDIDAKDLDLPCVPSHTFLVCASCDSTTALQDHKDSFLCASCGGSKAESVSIPCVKCVHASKKELERLKTFLVDDFGISQEEIRPYFSGNNGFHVHVSDAQFTTLDAQARSDLAGYIAGTGFMPESIGVRKGQSSALCVVKFPRGGIDYGWRKKVAEKLKIDTSSTIKTYNLVTKMGGYSAFKSELDRIASEVGISIDTQVTTDIHRIFRMPGTLNSKSGLAKTFCSDLESFDPFTDSCVLGDNNIPVRIKCPVKFRLKGKTFNASREVAELPTYAAVYLMCKGLAQAA